MFVNLWRIPLPVVTDVEVGEILSMLWGDEVFGDDDLDSVSGLSDDEAAGEVTFFCVEELGLSDELGEEIISFPKLEIS